MLYMPFFVYILISTSGCSYVGATIDLEHRLRQHNKEIKGGAYATSIKVLKGETWKRVCHISGFPDWKAALQFEWRLKHLSRKISNKMSPIERRINALKQLLKLDKPTSKAISYSEWNNPPLVNCETDEALTLWENESNDNKCK